MYFVRWGLRAIIPRAVLEGLTNNHRQANRRGEGCKRFPLDLSGQNGSEHGLARLMRVHGSSRCFRCPRPLLGQQRIFLVLCCFHFVLGRNRGTRDPPSSRVEPTNFRTIAAISSDAGVVCYAAFSAATSLRSAWAAAVDEAGFCPVRRRPSTTTKLCQSAAFSYRPPTRFSSSSTRKGTTCVS